MSRSSRLPVLGCVAAMLATAACAGGSLDQAEPGTSAGPAGTTAPASAPATGGTGNSAIASPPANATSSPATTSLSWGHCDGDHNSADTCALLAVPLDRAHPARTITLHLIRRVATNPAKRIGSLLLNPGGPGGSTVSEFDDLYSADVSSRLTSSFDVVGWDPRGVGLSAPVVCLDGPGLDSFTAATGDPTTPSGLAALVSAAKSEADACQAKSGDLLPFIGTVDSARDMDAIRVALGEPKLSYLGFSYGTLLGATYASLYPDKVRALVLDGAVDPGLGPIKGGEVQAAGFEQSLTAFLADCSSRGSSCGWHPGGDLLTHFRQLMAQIQQVPMPTGTSRPLTLALAQTGVAAALYSRDDWTYLEQGLAAAQSGDGHVLLALADFLDERMSNGSYSNLVNALNAVNCRDQQSPAGTAPYVASYERLLTTAPDFALLGFGGYICGIWPARPASEPSPLTATGVPPILVVGSTGDPATPLSEAVGLTARLSGARLLTRTGQGHTGYAASSCVRGYADSYLLDPTQLPPEGTTCASG